MHDTPQDPRIGVFVCHCGTNISHTVDTAAVTEYAATLPGVVVAKEYKYMCSDPGQDLIKEEIEKHQLDRVVVSSCSPLMHEETFRDTVEDAGLNRFLYQMANIREHCSWVHKNRQQATEKAKRLISGAVRRVRWHKDLTSREVEVKPEAMVVGAGIAGIESALKMADAGRKVYLVEKEPSIGGHMAKFDKTFPTLDCAACILTPKMTTVGKHPNIELMTFSEVEDVSGYVGNFHVKVREKARYVDAEKCTGCGSCIERCPVQNWPEDVTGHLNGSFGIASPVALPAEMQRVVDWALNLHVHEDTPLISVLQDINTDLGYLPADVLRYVSRSLRVSLAMVYHVATFYKAFSLTPRGKHLIKVCMGTACHVRGSQRILTALTDKLQIRPGETTKDMEFTLQTVNCLGACAMAPVVVIDEEYITLQPKEVDRIINRVLKGAPTPATAKAATASTA